jgi:predicted nucleic acid-binding protein
MEAQGDGLIVVDTNIIAYLLVRGEWTGQTRLLLERDSVWVAPSFWRIEFLNVLMNYARWGKLSTEDVRAIWKNSFHLNHLREEAVESDQALELAVKYKISGYDALFVALAQSHRIVCVTQDKALHKAVPHLTIGLEEFLKS